MQPGLQRVLVAGIGFGVGKDLLEQRLAIGGDTDSSLLGLDLVEKGKIEMLLEVPLELLFLSYREGIVDSNGIVPFLIEADGSVEVRLPWNLLTNPYHCHASPPF